MGITKELVRDLFDYRDGKLYHRKKAAIRVKIGDCACSYNKKYNRYSVCIRGVQFAASRIIFLWHHGYLPEVVDHIDRNPSNDNIENLRAASKADNSRNRTSQKNSTSKYLGVYLKRGFRNTATITTNGKRIHIGTYETEIEAALAYNREAVRHHGEFANLNIINAYPL